MIDVEFGYRAMRMRIMTYFPRGLLLGMMLRVREGMGLRVMPGIFAVPVQVLAGIGTHMDMGIIGLLLLLLRGCHGQYSGSRMIKYQNEAAGTDKGQFPPGFPAGKNLARGTL